MIRIFQRTFTVRPRLAALYALLFGAGSGILLAIAIIGSRSGSVQRFFTFLPLAIVFAVIVGGIVGLVCVGLGLGVRSLLNLGSRMNTTFVSVIASMLMLSAAVISIVVLSAPLDFGRLAWAPIIAAIIGAVWFALWSNGQPSRETQTQGDLQDGD